MSTRHSKTQLTALLVGIVFALVSPQVSADLVTSGNFTGSSANLGPSVVGSTTFNLTAAEITLLELDVDFDLIDDGVEIIVNGTSLFVSQETSQFGAQDFEVSGVQPNDINNPWNTNSSGLPRLNVFANSSGTAFSGAVSENDSTTVDYIPLFSVADFTSLLTTGSNTIEFVNHNGFAGSALEGSFVVSTSTSAVPEPAGLLAMMVLGSAIVLKRRR